jgi:hypothetical protein
MDMNAGPRLTHNVYVVELHPAVLRFEPFHKRNPGYEKGMPCVYVGLSTLTPERQFAHHMHSGVNDSLVGRYGLRLLPELYDYANPMPFDAAREMQAEVSEALRHEGYGVWQAEL